MSNQSYSHAFKMAIVERVENGQLSRNPAAKEYDVCRGSQHGINNITNLKCVNQF